MVVRVAQRAARCQAADQVAIASDSAAILQAAREFGFGAIRTASHHASGTDRVAEAAAKCGAEFVVNLQGDEPFVEPRDLEALFAALHRPTVNADIVTLKRPLTNAAAINDPACVKVVCADDGVALYFSRAPIPFCRGASGERRTEASSVFGHLGVYACRRAALERWCRAPVGALEACEGLEQLRAQALGMRILVLLAHGQGRGIDTPADLLWARQQLKDCDATPPA